MSNHIRVTLAALLEKPEAILGPEWQREGAKETFVPVRGIAIRAQAEDGITIHAGADVMFETRDFRARLTEAVSSEAAGSGLEYETEIISYLQRLASENESILMEREMQKAASERRGISDALISAKILARDASRFAVAEKRTVLKLTDVEAAYRAKFCQFWPFCKS